MCVYERELNRRLNDYLDTTGEDDDVIDCPHCEGRAQWDTESSAWVCQECGRHKGLDDDIDDQDYSDYEE